MSNPAVHHKINYVEFATTSIEAAKAVLHGRFWLDVQGLGTDYIDASPEVTGLALGFRRGEPGRHSRASRH